MRDDYRQWLVAQGYQDHSVAARCSNVRTVERRYGDLDEVISKQGIDGLVGELEYSKEDERRNKPNPSRIDIQGNIYNGLATLKAAIVLYQRFLTDAGATPGPAIAKVPPIRENDITPTGKGNVKEQRLSLERDMETALRRDIAKLEPGLKIVDGGAQRQVTSGRLDILCKDELDRVVVVELKAGKADRRVIGQTLGYMGDLMTEDSVQTVRGIIVAYDFDQSSQSVARHDPRLSLFTYAVAFTIQAVL